MAETDRKLANGKSRIDFNTDPSHYRHWKLAVNGDVAALTMDVDEDAPLFEGYQLKLNSYDLGVDIELADALERLRFEHPSVRVVLLRSGKPRVFCAGANIRMLAGASHAHKVNFCKFTNETRNAIEDMSESSGLKTICVVTGSCARPLPSIRIMGRPARTLASTSFSVMPPPFATIVTEGRPSASFPNSQYIVAVSEPQLSWAGASGSKAATMWEWLGSRGVRPRGGRHGCCRR